MQVFYSEYHKDYSSYTFGYAVYAIYEKNDSLSDLYAKGFLPYTGDIKNEDEIYYLARSVRVDLSDFEPGSENRRVLRKTASYKTQMEFIPKASFPTDDWSFLSFCLDYASERYKGGAMNEERLHYVLKRACATHIVRFLVDDVSVGYLLAGIDDDSLHYWFSFYDTRRLDYLPLGKWMMLEIIRWAREQDKKYVYLGTCYGPDALYKVRDFKGVSFFDGKQWRNDIGTLKEWCKNDKQVLNSDRFKLS